MNIISLESHQEIYNIFDTEKVLARPAKVSITNTSGLAEIGFWVNAYLTKQGKEKLEKSHPIIKKMYEWVQKEYEMGRITMISDEELIEQYKLCKDE